MLDEIEKWPMMLLNGKESRNVILLKWVHKEVRFNIAEYNSPTTKVEVL